eukprot:TRINITY_DN7465_c0_g1_i1.p1 TRINITY_DN7465_c0_g1~~TRINITY_DN7465_c0_g1_i1.p1  ORF type:complete len:332 (-),score=7.70 TRINITY_DN7465_c0_g1_i1:483-1478(-)
MTRVLPQWRLCIVILLCLQCSIRAAAQARKQNISTEVITSEEQYIDEHWNAYVAVCLIIKDAHKSDIREWILYHQYIGIGKIYMFDDQSKPSMLSLIQDFIDSGLVSYFYLGNMTHRAGSTPQTFAYNKCIHWFARQHKFVGLIDYDEFVVLRDDNNNLQYDFVSFLKQYEDYGGVVLYWRLFGSSGQTKHQKSTLDSYTKCYPSYDKADHKPEEQKSVRFSGYKTFFNTQYSKFQCYVHYCRSHRDIVNTEFQRVGGYRLQSFYATWARAFLNHYRVKSSEDFFNKIQLGPVNQRVEMSEYRMKYLQEVDELTTADCDYMKEAYQKCCKE